MDKFTTYLLTLFALVTVGYAKPLNVVTYNIRLDTRSDTGDKDWDQRKDKVVKYLLESKAGFIGMQEVLPAQLKHLTKSLSKYKYIGVGRDDGKDKGECSPIFYNPEIYQLDPNEQGTFWLSDTPAIAGSKTWGNTIPRICTFGRFTTKEGKGIYIYNTHWDHRSQNSREMAAKLILQRISQRKHLSEPVVLMGDFNASTQNAAIKTLLESPLLVDACKQQVLTFNRWQAGLKPGLRIDHIFTSPSLKNITVAVHDNGNPPASDHHPVQLTQKP